MSRLSGEEDHTDHSQPASLLRESGWHRYRRSPAPYPWKLIISTRLFIGPFYLQQISWKKMDPFYGLKKKDEEDGLKQNNLSWQRPLFWKCSTITSSNSSPKNKTKNKIKSVYITQIASPYSHLWLKEISFRGIKIKPHLVIHCQESSLKVK